jgi:hypothetical protein
MDISKDIPNNVAKPRNKLAIAFIVVACVLFVASAVLGYFYYKSAKNYKKLSDEKVAMETAKTKEVADLQAALAKATGKTTIIKDTAAEKDKTALEKQVSDYQAKIAKANAYNEFYKYLNSVIQAHGGYSGWTDAEFQIGKQKAEATGDAAFVSTVNWAWYETSIPPTDRIIRASNEIASGIENSLK